MRTHRRQIRNLPEHGRRRFPLVAAVIGRRRLAEEKRRGSSRGALRGNPLRRWRQQQRFRRDVRADNILAEVRVEDEFPCRVDGGVEGERWGAVHAVQVHASRVRPKAGPPKLEFWGGGGGSEICHKEVNNFNGQIILISTTTLFCLLLFEGTFISFFKYIYIIFQGHFIFQVHLYHF